jgi:hypothetical protein
LATRGVTKENEMPAPRRMSRAFESRARASRRARGGPSTRDMGTRARRVSGAFRRAFPLTRATAGWFERAIQPSTRHSNKWRQRGFRTTNAPSWRVLSQIPLRCFGVFLFSK